MAVPQKEIYTIFCVIEGEDTLFPIEIESSEPVGILKDMIKEARKNTLAKIDAAQLKLYHVEISDLDDMATAIKQKLSEHPAELGPVRILANVFRDGVKKETLIIVQPPKSVSVAAATTLPNHPGSLPLTPFTPTPDDKIKHYVARFAIHLRSTFEIFLRDNVQLPLWQPHLGSDDAIRSHIAGLKIPIISPSSQFPSLLLHNLGQPSHDAQLAERVDELFRPDSQETKFLCNTSGSGKTRLLFEGLWRNWGFYFTARTQPEAVGSSDLEQVLLDLERPGRLATITHENRATVLTVNKEVASRHSLLLLYVRFVCFRVFLECASAVPGGITEDHKGRWLLIQVAPKTLLSGDVFLAFTRLVGRASFDYLCEAAQSEHLAIKQLLGPSPPPLFCVLDEAQIPTNKFSDYFRSGTEPAQPRPILREIILTWTRVLPNLIVSGTGILMREVETVIGSVVAKKGGVPQTTVTEIGGFDDEVGQRAYLERYLPPSFLDTPLGKEIASRAQYWLRGRHRFTATYLSLLIRTSFESPHRVLNDLVDGITGFRPSDWDDDPALTVELGKPGGFSFPSLLKMSEKKPDLLTTLASFVFEYTFTGKISGLGGPNGDIMVEIGVSRFKKGLAETDEPLAILGLVNFLHQQHLTLERYLREALNVPNATSRGLAFEPFGAYLLARAFSAPTPLSQVFDFLGESELQHELAELVTLERTGDTFRITPLKFGSNLLSSHVLGCSPSTAADTLEWLQNPRGSAFCFPANTVGPDLIFVLRLTGDGTILRVCVQFKHKKELTSQQSEKAIRTTDPFNFFSQFKDDQWTISDPSMQGKMVEAIQNLGKGTKKAGVYGVLQVVIPHPSPLDDNTLEEAAKGSHRHPLATVAVHFLESPNSDLSQTILSLANQALGMPDRKRKSSDGIEGNRRKKQKTGTEVRG